MKVERIFFPTCLSLFSPGDSAASSLFRSLPLKRRRFVYNATSPVISFSSFNQIFSLLTVSFFELK